ncbi:MAG: ankyrin repeat domain-containing protein, partial [Acidobacteriota bacterium]
IDAARKGQLTTIREILDRHPTLINWVDEAGGRWGFRGRTALWAAVDRPRDSAEVVELLLERGASVDAHNAALNCWYAPEAGSPAVESATLLHLAAGKGDAATVHLLVEHGMSVLATDERGHGPLHAVESGDAEAEKVEILIELGADPNQKTTDGVTPLDVVRDDKSVAALLTAGANPDSGKDGTWPLKEAIRQGRVDVARRLIEAGADRDRRDRRGHSLLQIAAYVCQADSIRLLLEVGLSADGDKGPLSPLNRSLQRGHVEGVELLIKAGAEVAADALHGVTWLQGEASIRCAELLVSAGADPNAVEGHTQSTPLHSAASAGEVSAIDFLLSQGAKVDAQNTDGGTPLLEACKASKPEAVDRLLKAGAN